MTFESKTSSNREDELIQALLVVIQELINELRPGKRQKTAVTLDSSLDTDMGLDSLGRVELLSRIEQYFNVALSQQVFTEAETPRDLLRAITTARGREAVYPASVITPVPTEQIDDLPVDAQTLIDVLEWHVNHHPDRLHIRILDEEEEQNSLTYKQLWDGAVKVAAGLQQNGVQSGETVAIMLPTGKNYFFSFVAILLTGAVPVPIYPPVRRSQLEDHLRRHARILNNCRASMLVTIPEAKVVAQLLKSQVESLRDVVTVKDLKSHSQSYSRPTIGCYEIAFLQYTSGSTGNPKGVVLTHDNLLANIRAMGEAVEADSSDVFISWLPLYHDMGLIGAWLGSMYFAMTFIVMSPLVFLTRPQRWLKAIHDYRGTLSAAPNFGYELVLKRLNQDEINDLDLSSWRCAFNGAEPVSADTIKRFTETFQTAGFKSETMMPVYGLAESSVGLAFPPLHQEPRIDCVQRELFSHTHNAKEAEESDRNALCFVTCGQSLPGHYVRIVDNEGNELDERQEGFLQFKGPSATTGYYRNPEATKNLFSDEWLDTGDLAYIADGYIYVTGRSKDLIIRAGRNIYPQELEEAVGNIDGVRKGCVVTFGAVDPHTGTERLVVIAETRSDDENFKIELQKSITTIANDLIELPPDEVIIAPPHTVLKTSSGKVRRSACRESYEQGRLGQTQAALVFQIARTVIRSTLPVWHRLKRKTSNLIFAIYAWLVFYMLAIVSWVSVVALPVLQWRWSIIRSTSKLLAVLTGTQVKVIGLDNLLDSSIPCIYVANHQSYLDGMLMVAVLPRTFRNVAKAELQQSTIARLFLNKMGVEYVERFDKERGLVDAKRITETAQQNNSLFIFPEGTFQRIPGLMDFHMGAFLSAAEADVSVVPIAIRGTRSILRAGSWFPRRGRISVNFGEPIDPSTWTDIDKTDKWKRALRLREIARKHILHHCGEPDISRFK